MHYLSLYKELKASTMVERQIFISLKMGVAGDIDRARQTLIMQGK